MRHVSMFFLILANVTTCIAEPLPPDAAKFIAQGARTALSQCDLPKRTCNTTRLALKSADVGESNDEKRSVETLAAKGMEALVSFPLANRKNYYLGSVEITSAQWLSYKGIMVGSPRDAVVQTLGLPNNGSSNSCDSYLDDEHGSEALVCYRAGNVSRIRWEYFVD